MIRSRRLLCRKHQVFVGRDPLCRKRIGQRDGKRIFLPGIEWGLAHRWKRVGHGRMKEILVLLRWRCLPLRREEIGQQGRERGEVPTLFRPQKVRQKGLRA